MTDDQVFALRSVVRRRPQAAFLLMLVAVAHLMSAQVSRGEESFSTAPTWSLADAAPSDGQARPYPNGFELGPIFACVGEACGRSAVRCTSLIWPDSVANWHRVPLTWLANPSVYREYTRTVRVAEDVSRLVPELQLLDGEVKDEPSHVATAGGLPVAVHTLHVLTNKGSHAVKLTAWLVGTQLYRVTCVSADDGGLEAVALDFTTRLARSRRT